MSHDSGRKSATRRLTILYVASLSGIAALAILGQVIVQRMLAQQERDVQVLALAETQQKLSHQLSKTALGIQFSPDPSDRQDYVKELQQLMQAWHGCRTDLKQSATHLKLSGQRATHAQRMFTDLEPVSQKLEQAATGLLQQVSDPAAAPATPEADPLTVPSLPRVRRSRDQQTPALPRQQASTAPRHTQSATAPLVRQILQADRIIARSTGAIVQQYNESAAAGVTRLRQLELGLMVVTLAVLVLEGGFVFRPAVQKIRQTLADLAVALAKSQEMSRQLSKEQAQSERLLLNILPEPIAARLKQNQGAIADGFGEATVLFADIVGFTELSSRLSPAELVALLNDIFSRFDALAEKHQLEKIKTIGDAYMVVGGLPQPRQDHAWAIAEMALDMQEEIIHFNRDTGEQFSMRIGINTGPVIAGVIGIKKFIYDLWGDTVNIASRMESHGMPGRIQVTEATYQALMPHYHCEPRGTIQVKGKGEMTTYWLKGRC